MEAVAKEVVSPLPEGRRVAGGTDGQGRDRENGG